MQTIEKKKKYLKVAAYYFAVSVFVALFSAVYEYFSHGVTSLSMIFAFAPSLLLGALPALVLYFVSPRMSAAGRVPYRLAVASFTVGMIFKGVIEIYGTDSPLTKYYFFAGTLLLAVCAVLRLSDFARKNKHRSVNNFIFL